MFRKFFNDGKHNMQTRGLLVLLMAKTAGPCAASDEEHREKMVSGIYPRLEWTDVTRGYNINETKVLG